MQLFGLFLPVEVCILENERVVGELRVTIEATAEGEHERKVNELAFACHNAVVTGSLILWNGVPNERSRGKIFGVYYKRTVAMYTCGRGITRSRPWSAEQRGNICGMHVEKTE